MSKRKVKNIANGIICSFISRNNDVMGYWGIGKLYSLMLKQGTMIITIDLLNQSIVPYDNEFKYMIKFYHKMLLKRLSNNHILLNEINELKIITTGHPNKSKTSLGKLASNRVVFEIITRYENKIVNIKKEVWCRKHNPKSELKSCRKYESKNNT